MHDAPHTPAGEPSRRLDPGLDPRPDWRVQTKNAYRLGYTLVGVSISGLIGSLASIPSNGIQALFQSFPSLGFVTGVTFQASPAATLFIILTLFLTGLRSIYRGWHLENKVTRYAIVYGDPDNVPKNLKESLSLIENGPPTEKTTTPQESLQLSLFPGGEPSPRTGRLATIVARIMRLA